MMKTKIVSKSSGNMCRIGSVAFVWVLVDKGVKLTFMLSIVSSCKMMGSSEEGTVGLVSPVCRLII